MGNFDLLWRSFAFNSLNSLNPSKDETSILPLQEEEVDKEILALQEQAKKTGNLLDGNQIITKTEQEIQLENLLSNLLKYGVLLASAVVLFGGIIYLVHQWDEPARYHFFRGEPSQFRSPDGVIKAILAGSDRAIVQLGLILLIAIPILRVIISLIFFIIVRNFLYVGIVFLVLCSLAYSVLGAYF